MSTTMSRKIKTSIAPVSETHPVTGNAATIDISPSEKLRKECVGCRVTFNWYRTSKQVEATQKKEMAQAVGTGEDAYSASKRLMDSKHPIIKEANELQRRVDGFFKSQTIILAAFAGGRGKPEPGVRLIAMEKVDEFDRQMQAFKAEVKVMERKLNEALPDIMTMDKARLKGLFNEKDYPKDVTLDLTWGFVSVEVPAAMEKLAPAVYRQEIKKLEERMEDTYELATITIFEQFLSIIQNWLTILGPLVRIYPDASGPLGKYNGAEIREEIRADKDDSLKASERKLLLRYYPQGKTTFTEEWLTVASDAEYAALNPTTTSSEMRTFKDTTIGAMTQFLSDFRNVSNTISSSDTLNSLVRNVENHLAQCRSTTDAAKELRSSHVFRTNTHALMQKLDTQVKSEMETFRKARRMLG